MIAVSSLLFMFIFIVDFVINLLYISKYCHVQGSIIINSYDYSRLCAKSQLFFCVAHTNYLRRRKEGVGSISYRTNTPGAIEC